MNSPMLTVNGRSYKSPKQPTVGRAALGPGQQPKRQRGGGQQRPAQRRAKLE